MPLKLTSNTLGGHYALTVLTPIAPGAEDPLRAYLEGFEDQGASPFARLPRTHFGRWVIVAEFITDPSQRREEDLGGPWLLFSATFDGELDSYLDELGSELGDEAEIIWGSCIGAPQPARGSALKPYLIHNQIDTGLFFSAYPEATVQDVRGSLRDRDRTLAFAVRAQGMPPDQLRQAFLDEF
jgi:hypothetical protein